MLGDHELGVSKTDFDARFHMHAINDALDVAAGMERERITYLKNNFPACTECFSTSVVHEKTCSWYHPGDERVEAELNK